MVGIMDKGGRVRVDVIRECQDVDTRKGLPERNARVDSSLRLGGRVRHTAMGIVSFDGTINLYPN